MPDNTKTAKACRYDPDLNPTYQEMAMHYGVGVLPARPYKPRDKAKVELGVQLAERWIIAALRNRRFLSIEELNFLFAGHITISERQSIAGVPLSDTPSRNRPLGDLPIERNQDLQPEAELHSKPPIPCEASLKTSCMQ
jgi:hypothetical protein